MAKVGLVNLLIYIFVLLVDLSVVISKQIYIYIYGTFYAILMLVNLYIYNIQFKAL